MYPTFSPWMIGVNLPFHQCARMAADAGFKGIAVDLAAAARDPDGIRGILEVNKLKPAAWGLPVEFRQDEETYRAGLARLSESAKAAKQIGADRCSTWIRSSSDTLTFRQNFQLHQTRLRPCAEILAEHGCRLGLEFVAPRTLRQGHAHEFIHTLEGMLELCQTIGTPNLGLLLDSFHWYTSHSTPEDIRNLSDALMVDVHINDAVPGRGPDDQIDNDRRLPGATGVIDLTAFLQALNAIGYTGPVTPEPFYPKLREMPPEDAIRTTAEALLSVWKRAL